MSETAALRVTQDRWSWPISQSAYDRFTGLYPNEIDELAEVARRNRFGCWSRKTQENLARLRCPVQAALKIIGARDSCWCTCTTVLLLEMHRRQESFWGWNNPAWIETLCTRPADFCDRHALAGDEVRPHLAAIAYLLGCFQDIPELGTISYVALAREVFGRSRVNDSIRTAVDAITAWGYGAGRAYDLKTTLGVLFLANRSPDLRDLTVSFLEEQRRLSTTSRRSGSILTVSKVLMTLGLTGRALSHPP